jgi:hypothetical protein
LIESGCFFQRADVTDLEVTADDGAGLSVEARFETAAWSDRLSLILAARLGLGTESPADKQASSAKAGEAEEQAVMEIRLATPRGTMHQRREFRNDQYGKASAWCEVCLTLDPVAFRLLNEPSPVKVEASEIVPETIHFVDRR